jgi:fructose-1,6-bisphosphatase I/sedoheptulose-1,7-bisphosphatase
MLTTGRSTLTQFLIEERRRHPDATGELNALITELSLTCKTIARKVAYGALGGVLDGLLNRGAPAPPRGKYLLLFDPLDDASNVDVNVAVGSIFSVLRAVTPGHDPQAHDFLQPGTQQVCAGYAIYGPSTMLVLTLGRGTQAFTLDPLLGEWVLSHPELRIPEKTCEFAINASNSRFWEPAVKRYVDECLAGQTGTRGADFNMRWIASLVAETHRILMRGGVFLCPRCPRDGQDASRAGPLRLLQDANPIAFLVEQAGGGASTGRARLMEVKPESLQQRIGFVFGSRHEVARIETYHRDEPAANYDSPLFGKRGLFAATV